MGIFDFFKGNEKSKKYEDKNFLNIKTYKAIDGSIIDGEGLKGLIEIARMVQVAVKAAGATIQSNGEKKVKYNNGKILEDWEGIKSLVETMTKNNPKAFVMTLEALAFCEWDFGKIPHSPIDIPIELAKFWKGDINEDKLDSSFSSALEISKNISETNNSVD